jgi:hypothetical protein
MGCSNDNIADQQILIHHHATDKVYNHISNSSILFVSKTLRNYHKKGIHDAMHKNLVTGEYYHYHGDWWNIGTVKELEALKKFLSHS